MLDEDSRTLDRSPPRRVASTSIAADDETSAELGEANRRLTLLRGLCHAFASSSSVEEAYAGASRWAREAVNDPDATVRIVRPESDGALRVVFSDGPRGAGQKSDTKKRGLAFQNMRTSLDSGSQGTAVARIPLASRGEPIGLLEVVSHRDALVKTLGILTVVASQSAIVLRNLNLRAEQRQETALLERLIGVVQEVLSSGELSRVLDTAAKFCDEELGVPTAAWVSAPGGGMKLVSVRGLPHGKVRTVRTEMGVIPRWDSLSLKERGDHARRFAELAGTGASSFVAEGQAFFVSGGQLAGVLLTVHMLLESVISHLTTVTEARRRNEQLDLALAMTAHEFRSPLVGMSALLDHVFYTDMDRTEVEQKLHDLQDELHDLLAWVEPLLEWSAGAAPLHRRRTDVARLVEEATAPYLNGGQPAPVRMEAGERVMASVDSHKLRTAVSNLIRNAIAHSPVDSPVEVAVRSRRDEVVITVTDRGPGIPAPDRERIFDPFMRGESRQNARYGKGLGLFIARRVTEAHGGRIWVESSGEHGAVFHLSIGTDRE